MPTLRENIDMWNGSYDWTQEGNEWSSAWGSAEAEWFGTLLPRIHQFIPVETILEIAPGYGRWTEYLKDYCENLIVVDISEKCIEACKRRFSASSHITYHVNDGRSLAMVPDGSIDFVFSFDSLVHAEADVLEAYLHQLARKLKPNGVGFIHHSNLGMYAELVARTKLAPQESRAHFIETGELIDLAAWHAESMTARLFEEYCDAAGLQCVSQELINWFNRYLIACFSAFTPKNSIWARRNTVVENADFMDEVKRSKALSQLYFTSADYECFHNDSDGDQVLGWVWNRNNPTAQVAVDIFDGETLLGSISATERRPDIAAYTKGNGCHGFSYDLPASLKDGRPHKITVKVKGTNIDAYGTPKVYIGSHNSPGSSR